VELVATLWGKERTPELLEADAHRMDKAVVLLG